MDTRTNPHRARIDRLRETLARESIHALLVPSADPHLSEYLPGHWQAREWFSGFTGSMGTLVVTVTGAALFADSRYWVQAEAELVGSGIELVKIPTGNSTKPIEWLAENTPAGATVAVDGQVLGLGMAQLLRTSLDKAGVRLRTDIDCAGLAWPGRPPLPTEPVYEHRPPHAPVARQAKLAQVRDAMSRHGATHHFVSTVDDIAWITNLRGSDVSYNPVFLAHLLISLDRAWLFVGLDKVSPALQSELAATGLEILPYEQAALELARLPSSTALLLDPRRVTQGLRDAVPAAVRIIEASNPSTLLKSRKTAAEADHIREAMAEDGAAQCEFYARFEQALARGERLTELTVDEWMTEARARRQGFVGLSFNTIAGFNGNGAMPHYRALPHSHAAIDGDGLLLIDSGGQYLGGTTDITRVWPIGQVSPAIRADCTRVLQGLMSLSRARFPRGTLGPMLDSLARAPLWAHGLDYGHGTGHGVGYFLNVHEGPQSISRTLPEPQMALEPGMVTSIEPGIYRPGQWGVRIENLVLTVPAASTAASPFGEFLEFETLSLCPIDSRCLDTALLRDDERSWLNQYQATVRERLSPRVAGDARAWLETRTQAVG